MTFNTLDTIIDDIMLELRNSNITESERLSRLQIEQWINNYRAMLIKQDIDKGRDINPSYVQNTQIMIQNSMNPKIPQNTDKQIPKTIDFHFKSGILSIVDDLGNTIQLGTKIKSDLQSVRKYAKKDTIAYMKGDVMYFPNVIKRSFVDIALIAEVPTSVDSYDDTKAYPVPANMITVIKDLIFSKELNIMQQMPTDDTNDSVDNTGSNALNRGK